eukprot:gene3397-3887_t
MPFGWHKPKTKPVKIFITPNTVNAQRDATNQVPIIALQNMMPRVDDIESSFDDDGDLQDTSHRAVQNKLRRRSRTEPAISLSKYRRNRLGNHEEEQHEEIGSRKSNNNNAIVITNNHYYSGSHLPTPLLGKFGSITGDIESVIQAGTVGSIASFSGSQLFSTVVEDHESVDTDIFNNFEFPLTNLVFEGGGNKGMAYVGVLEVLEEAGVMKNIKRVAGSSVGAIVASLVALGFTSQDLKEFMDQDLRKVLVDHKCGYCSLLPNLLEGFGWNPGKRLLKWFGEQLRERTGNADITFKELLHQFGRELCIVVTNLSQMTTEYFHPKTTPNTPVRTAVRMSTAMPGVFQSVLYKVHEDTDVYVDGGLLCNYPIHAFDGWWLSMEPKDSFFQRLQPLDEFPRLFSKSERFGKWNNKTLGIILYSHTETELMKTILKARQGSNPPRQPNTKLYRKRRKMRMKQRAAQIEHQHVVTAVGRLIKELRSFDIEDDGVINKREMHKLFSQSIEFTDEDKYLLFGSTDFLKAFQELDTDSDGEITFQELLTFLERKGVGIQTRFLGYTRKEITHLSDFISTLQTALSINVKRNYVEERDVERTIGIDTDYIETNDFELEQEDKDFLIETGARAARAFLRDFAKKHPECRRRGSAMLSRAFFESPRLKKKISSSYKTHRSVKSTESSDSLSSFIIVEKNPYAEDNAFIEGLIGTCQPHQIIALILMTLPVYFKIHSLLNSWPINGGIISVGVFLLVISLAGIYGAWKQHQIVLFFYMVILVVLFILMFAFSLAALVITQKQQYKALRTGWVSSQKSTKRDLQRFGNCCGFENKSVTTGPLGHPPCLELPCCKESKNASCPKCSTCLTELETKSFKKFRQATGGAALFFSFTMFLGVYLAFQYRHMRNPTANPNEFL